MADRTQLELMTAVREFVAAATGLDPKNVVLGNQSAPAPNGPYATVTTIDIDPVGIDWQVHTETTPGSLDTKTTGSREASFSVQFFRGTVAGSSMDKARAVLQYAKTPNGQFLLQQNKLAWRAESAVTQTDQVNQGNAWEGRAALTLNFGIIDTVTQAINHLTDAEIGIEFSGETDISEELNVSSG